LDNKIFNTHFDLIHNATINELPDILINMIWELCEDGMVTQEELFAWLNSKPEQALAILEIKTIAEYFENHINLKDYDLLGCEFTEDDYKNIAEKMRKNNKSLIIATHEYLTSVRETLYEGLDS
jgi:hypothetical protein